MVSLPEQVQRWCCPGKSCGNTTLYLVDNDSPPGWPPLYDYVRSNGTSYMGWADEQATLAWLDRTKDNLNP